MARLTKEAEPEADTGSMTPTAEPEVVAGVKTNGGDQAEAKRARSSALDLTQLGFWDQINALTDSQWQFHVAYLYRLEPAIRNDSGRNFIEKFRGPFDESTVMQVHGSGKFLAILNNTRTRKTIGKLTFSCYHPDQPPRIRLEQLAPDADESWRRWLEEVETHKAKTRTDGQGASAERSGANDAALASAIGELGAISKRLLEQRESGSPLDAVQGDVDRLNALLNGIKNLLPATPAQPSELTTLKGILEVAEKLKPTQNDPLAALEKVVNVLDKLRPPEAERPEPKTLLDDLEQALTVVGRLREAFGAGGENPGPPRENTADVIRAVAPHVEGALHELGGILSTAVGAWLANRGAAAVPGSPPPGTLPPRPSFAPGVNARPAGPVNRGEEPGATPPAAPGAPPPAPPGNAPGAPSPLATDPDVQQLAAFVPALAEPLLAHLNADATGEDFADWVSAGYGALAYHAIRNLGKQKFIAALQLHPQLWAQLAALGPQFDGFLDEFLSWQPEAEEGEAPEMNDVGESAARPQHHHNGAPRS